jgi:hypothetical protein
MPGNLLQIGMVAACPHSGNVQATPGSARVRIAGQPALRSSDVFLISGCPFMVGVKAQPCLKLQWLVTASRVRIEGQPALLSTSTGICQSAEQIPQGPPLVMSTQTRVRGT